VPETRSKNPPVAQTKRSLFRREGEPWRIEFAGAVCELRDSAGLRQVAYLLGRPGVRVPATELIAQTTGSVEEGTHAEPVDAHRVAERARVRVAHAIHHALDRIAVHHTELNEHLRATIRTGTSCVYLPDPRRTLRWDL
jgi:hypothetical protein